jgi:hypothetical protein
MTSENFIRKVRRDASAYGIRVTISNTKYVSFPNEKTKLNGYFLASGKRRELAIATKKPFSQWLPVLIHESCHMDQYLERSPIWNVTRMHKGNDAFSILDSWVNGKEYAPSTIIRAINAVVELEKDCEKRAIMKIEELRLPIKRSIYVKKANAYIMSFVMLYRFRRWYPIGMEPYRIKRVWGNMPNQLISNFWKSSKYTYLYREILKDKRRHV